jgi:hypothetical protein
MFSNLFFINHSFSVNNALFTVCATSVPIGGIIHNVLTDNDWLAYLIRSTPGPDKIRTTLVSTVTNTYDRVMSITKGTVPRDF